MKFIRKLQITAKEEPTESLIKGYSLNENGFLLFKDKLYVLMCLRLSC